MSTKVWAALENSQQFICEADTQNIDPSKVTSYLYFKPPRSLESLIGKKKTAAIAKAMESPLAQVKTMRPWFLSSLLILKMEKNPGASMDVSLQTHAADFKKNLIFLETYDQQIEMLAGINEKEMAEALYEMTADMAETKKNYKMMGNLYRGGDAKKLVAFTSKEMGKIPGMEAKLLYTRNKNWIPKLTGAMKKRSTFAAVGLAHLVGKGSVVSLLRKQGYKVTPVSTGH